MAKVQIVLSSGFEQYQLGDVIGEGGAGRVFAATTGDGTPVAVKILTHSSRDKLKRFKNELAFLERNEHPNIVSVIDRGNAVAKSLEGPFYVMKRYGGSLRALLNARIPAHEVLGLFAQILDGVEAAHLKGVVHRDLKPENILFYGSPSTLAVADFGAARFSESELATAIATRDGQRLANFVYCSPEQRTPGASVGQAADLFALGLMLNEMFTGSLAHGDGYPTIESVSPEHAYLDEVVKACVSHSPSTRPSTVAALKGEIARRSGIFLAEQKLSSISGQVIDIQTIDQPLAKVPPTLTGFDYEPSTRALQLKLDRSVDRGWVEALNDMGNYSSVLGLGPENFRFSGATASVTCSDHQIQPAIDYFKSWLPVATQVYASKLAAQAEQDARAKQRKLEDERAAQEKKAGLLKSIRI